MFKSIEYLNSTYDNSTQKYTYNYHLVDDNFECDVSVVAATRATTSRASARLPMAATALEYHKRNLNIIKNLYLLNNHLLEHWYKYWSFERLLNYQNNYMDKHYPIPGMSFSKDIYPKVKEMYEKLNTFK